jgi:molybdate transport system substrate-binding protein
MLLFVLLVAAATGCSAAQSSGGADAESKTQAAAQQEPSTLRIMSAASLKDVLQHLAPDFEAGENARIIFNFASSGDLQVQIEQGAPADLFISAGKKQVDTLEQKGLLQAGTRVDLLANDLVVIVPEENRAMAGGIEDLVRNAQIEKVAICIPEASPAGKYAQEALVTAGIWSDIQPKLVMAKDVRQIVTYVETGNVDAGLVYRSDANVSTAARIALVIPAEFHSPIVYPAAVLKNAGSTALAARFIEYLAEEEPSQAFKEYGFKVLREQ